MSSSSGGISVNSSKSSSDMASQTLLWLQSVISMHRCNVNRVIRGISAHGQHTGQFRTLLGA